MERLEPLIHKHDVDVSTAWMERGAALLTNEPGAVRIQVAAASDVAQRNIALAVLLETVERGLGGTQHRFVAEGPGPGNLAAMYRRYWVPFIYALRRVMSDSQMRQAEREGLEDPRRAAEEWDVPVEFVVIRLRDWREDLLKEVEGRIRSLHAHRSRGRWAGPSDEPPPPEAPVGLPLPRSRAEMRLVHRDLMLDWQAQQAATPIVPSPPAQPPARFALQPPPPRPAAPTGPPSTWTHSQKTIAIQRTWEAREAERLYCQDGDGI